VGTIPREAGIPPQKLVAVDEHDGTHPSTRVKSGEFVAYFKRSFVEKVRLTQTKQNKTVPFSLQQLVIFQLTYIIPTLRQSE
jgi:hypothetical protein